MTSGPTVPDLVASMQEAVPADDETYYWQLETGARFLAPSTAASAERQAHLGMARKYARLREDAKERG